MTEKPPMQRVTEIARDVASITTDELQLAVAKIKKPATEAGVGAGLLGAAGVLVLNTLPLFGLLFVTLFTWLYTNWLGIFPSIALGFLTEALILLIVAAVLALIGKRKAERIKDVKPTIDESKARLQSTVNLAKASIESGQQKVAALTSAERRPELDTR